MRRAERAELAEVGGRKALETVRGLVAAAVVAATDSVVVVVTLEGCDV
jgi:hypothetical protein